jgi:hypothetical protein
MAGIAPVIPWEPCNIPSAIQDELNRRKVNRSFVYIDANKGGWSETGENAGDWRKYRGPTSPWVRFCSNGMGREFETNADGSFRLKNGKRIPLSKIKPGFVLFGGKTFYSGYGFNNVNSSPDSIIGYLPDGIHTHTISNDLQTSNYPIHVPPPEIEKINVIIQKELYRKATVDWICFSKAQLEYMTPYFLVPGISCILEWGWNNFDSNALLNLDNPDELKVYNNNPYPLYNDHIIKAKGNYDVIFGRVTNFEWAIEGTRIRCKTEITSQDRIYSGVVVDSTSVTLIDDAKKEEVGIKPENNLQQFIEKYLPSFKTVGTKSGSDIFTIHEIYDVLKYISANHPNNWREYAYGVFYGRDKQDIKHVAADTDRNLKEDFDHDGDMKELWINFGLVVEIVNYHVSKMKSFKKAEIFRIDIDDVVITGHPNLISGDGKVLLIPNAEAPKYFKGRFSKFDPTAKGNIDYKVMSTATNPLISLTNRDDAKASKTIADYRLAVVCGQGLNAYRDDLNILINRIRIEKCGSNSSTSLSYPFEFPFLFDRNPEIEGSNGKKYPARYSGYLKNLYVNIGFLQETVKDSKTYIQFIEKILNGISSAAGGFWDFRIVGGTGKAGQSKNKPATLKIVDYKFVNTLNSGAPFTFDYFDADSLLLGLNFKPTLSNAQAIRTIYAQTNNPDSKTVITNGDNELLDYHFRDRLIKDDNIKENENSPSPKAPNNEFLETMRELQQLSGTDAMYQMTNRFEGKIIIRRLVLPASNVLSLLLDDGDEENNPKYSGIMPGIQATFTIQGIGGLRTFMMFLVRNLPEPYSEKNIVFRIVDVQEAIESGKWITTITAGLVPLRGYIKERLGIPNI